MARKQTAEEFWHRNLTEHSGLGSWRRLMGHLPSSPRCKICNVPFGAPGGPVMRVIGRPPNTSNPTLCDPCARHIKDYPGGAEVELSMLFADVRGSTSLAERMSAEAFSQLMRRFYAVATDVLVDANAMVGNLAGDQAIGYFFPAFAGRQHARVAIQAGKDLLQAVTEIDEASQPLPVGAGVHTGSAFSGTIEGAAGLFDFAVLGDAVNTTARLASLAGPGELLISDAAAGAAELDTTGLEPRELELRGRAEPVRVWVHRLDPRQDAVA